MTQTKAEYNRKRAEFRARRRQELKAAGFSSQQVDQLCNNTVEFVEALGVKPDVVALEESKFRYDLTGLRFNKLLVVEKLGLKKGHRTYLCQCDCGVKKVMRGSELKNGVKSCGCARFRGKTYRHKRTYQAWIGIKTRCQNPRDPGFKNYGGRGITVCERWQVYSNFLADMGECPPHLSIDRIDNNKGYAPGNCRWATRNEQARNRRSTLQVTWQGETKSASDWNDQLSYPYGTITTRLRKGWTVEDTMTKPPRNLPKKSERKIK